jgi:hypothetical protein
VTTPRPIRETPHTPPPDIEPAVRASQPVPDPWGVKRAENLIAGLTGVLSASIVVTAAGEISEIHVLAQPDTPPKQVVRNIESALMAQLGVKVDHRKISVA